MLILKRLSGFVLVSALLIVYSSYLDANLKASLWFCIGFFTTTGLSVKEFNWHCLVVCLHQKKFPNDVKLSALES